MKIDLINSANDIAFEFGFEDLFVTGEMIKIKLEELRREEYIKKDEVLF